MLEDFTRNHKPQLDVLNIPDVFFLPIKEQLERSYIEDKGGLLKQDATVAAGKENIGGLHTSDIGAMLAIPHVCSWDMLEESNTGLWDALSKLPVSVLQEIHGGLKKLWMEPLGDATNNKETLLNQICDPRIWSRVILYQKGNQIRGALPAPPFLLQVDLKSEIDDTEGDLSGPFPFQYQLPSGNKVDCSLAYLNPGITLAEGQVPTIDWVPAYGVANAKTRCIRYAALLGKEAPSFAIESTKELYANFVHQMHLVRQQQLEVQAAKAEGPSLAEVQPTAKNNGKIWKIYTDTDDPLGLGHPEAGLSKEFFKLVDDPDEADFIYSYQSLFAPGPLRDVWQTSNRSVLINQFPYEGAFLQKDHLGREVLKQHGLPRPHWAIETYDLDVQLGEFAGSALLETERSSDGEPPPIWIIKPANGTRSQGHVVTRSIGQVQRLVDAGGVSRVAQRYITNPVSYKGRKVDCRTFVVMTSAANGSPAMCMYNRHYFRIAAKPHSIASPSDLMDHKSVLSAMYFVEPDGSSTSEETDEQLPIDTTTIAQLEADYGEAGFQWEERMLPKIKTMVRELFYGMATAYPAMGENVQYRALYGVDLMFSIEDDGSIEPKLTEVSFCPSNLAISKEYERSDEDFRNYLTDVFKCLILDEVTDNLTRL